MAKDFICLLTLVGLGLLIGYVLMRIRRSYNFKKDINFLTHMRLLTGVELGDSYVKGSIVVDFHNYVDSLQVMMVTRANFNNSAFEILPSQLLCFNPTKGRVQTLSLNFKIKDSILAVYENKIVKVWYEGLYISKDGKVKHFEAKIPLLVRSEVI